ncbi:MAG: YaaR family protein [bacterium]
MKVEEAHTRFKEFEEAMGVGRGKRTKKAQIVKEKEEKQHPFAEKIREETLKALKEELSGLILKIEEKGKVLLNSPTYENLINYKELVATFVQYAVQNIWQLEEKKSGRFAKTQKVHLILKRIDENLLLLTDEVLKKERDVLRLASTIDEIQGLLIDLFS